MLDTYKADNQQPTVTTTLLPQGTYHFLTVSGTVAQGVGPAICGTGVSVSINYPSPAKPQGGWSGVDAETAFAEGDRFTGCTRQLPRHNPRFVIDTGDGSGFQHLEPAGGPYTQPLASHTYNYLVTGAGNHVQLQYRFIDSPTSDNSGQFRIVVRQAGVEDCKMSAWRQFGAFKTQGDCVSFMATDERNKPGAG
ncbi:MAG: hypothetical protein JWM64_2681 [Frankiales bacterium]|nr:hypothetical protein [Frankiales bacterium]